VISDSCDSFKTRVTLLGVFTVLESDGERFLATFLVLLGFCGLGVGAHIARDLIGNCGSGVLQILLALYTRSNNLAGARTIGIGVFV
jgi:hypothetical protein